MKKFWLSWLLLPLVVFAQNTSGEISYREVMKIEIKLPPEMEAQMRDRIPSSRTENKLLIFNESAMVYKADEKKQQNNDMQMEGEGMRFRMMGDRAKPIHYTDLENDKTVSFREFLGREFLIKGDVKPIAWKITNEEQKILAYTCRKAVAQDTSLHLVVWFTSEIPVSVGPNELGQLPGAILKAEYRGGKRVITATNVELKPIAADAIQAPTKGKEITQAEFDRLVEEKMREMGGRRGPGGGGPVGGTRMEIRINN